MAYSCSMPSPISGMQIVSGCYLHVNVPGKRFVLHFQYDRKQRKERAEILMPGNRGSCSNSHDPNDVAVASQDSGLAIEDYFLSALLPGWWYTGPVSFFVLRCGRTPGFD